MIVPISLTRLQKEVYRGILERNGELLLALSQAQAKKRAKAAVVTPALAVTDGAIEE
jgi:hypothetical protein